MGCSGEDTIARGLTNDVVLEQHTLVASETPVWNPCNLRSLVHFVELLPAPSPGQPHPGPAFLRCLSSQALSVLSIFNHLFPKIKGNAESSKQREVCWGVSVDAARPLPRPQGGRGLGLPEK